MIDTVHLGQWLGREQQATDEVSRQAAQRVAALLDWPARAWRRADPLPRCWYAALFAPVEPQARLGPDGHPRKGDFLPPVPLPRRLLAGRRVLFHEPLRIGDEVKRISRITGIEFKQGRSGEMCFVTVRHEIAGPRGLAVVEEQNIVYRGEARAPAAGESAAASKSSVAADTQATGWSRTVVPDPALLFRYSAITFNAHRIHYDAAYAREAEGYADLVVNGGLTTLLLWDLATSASGREIRSSVTRNVRTLFVNRAITLRGSMSVDHAEAQALDDTGEVAIDALLELES